MAEKPMLVIHRKHLQHILSDNSGFVRKNYIAKLIVLVYIITVP